MADVERTLEAVLSQAEEELAGDAAASPWREDALTGTRAQRSLEEAEEAFARARPKWCTAVKSMARKPQSKDKGVGELDREVTEADESEKDAQADYATLMADAGAKKAADSNAKTDKTAAQDSDVKVKSEDTATVIPAKAMPPKGKGENRHNTGGPPPLPKGSRLVPEYDIWRWS